jgi:hypothetical protein
VKCCFVDVDGVLNNPGCYSRGFSGNRVPADPRYVAALNRITMATGAVIIVSSTWRLAGLMFCREKFREWGVEAPVIDVTAKLHNQHGQITVAQPRGLEIAKWLEDNAEYREVESFVIIDDDGDMEPNMDRLVLCAGHVGLTMADAEKAVAILNKPVRTNRIEVMR